MKKSYRAAPRAGSPPSAQCLGAPLKKPSQEATPAQLEVLQEARELQQRAEALMRRARRLRVRQGPLEAFTHWLEIGLYCALDMLRDAEREGRDLAYESAGYTYLRDRPYTPRLILGGRVGQVVDLAWERERRGAVAR